MGFLFPADFYLEAEVSLDEAEWLEEENIEAESQSIGLTICTPFPVSCKAGVAGLSNNSALRTSVEDLCALSVLVNTNLAASSYYVFSFSLVAGITNLLIPPSCILLARLALFFKF